MKNGKNGTLYSVAFTRDGSPSKLLGFGEFLHSPAEAKAKVDVLRKKAKADGHKNFGRTWDYAAVAITPLR